DDLDLGAANPWGVACTADSKTICVTHAGTHEMSIVDATGMLEKLAAMPEEKDTNATNTGLYATPTVADVPNDLVFLVGLRRRIPLGDGDVTANGPRGLAVVGSKAFAVGYFTDTLSVVDLEHEPDQAVSTIALGPVPDMSVERRGQMYFHDATVCFQHWQSCASCHPDARPDGLNWDLMNDGLGNPKNTRSMLLAHRTAPSMSSGVFPNAEAAVHSGFLALLFTAGTEEVVEGPINKYLKSLQPVSSPYLVDGKLSPAARRGEKLFFDAKIDCAKCHPKPLFTDKLMHDVGSRGQYDRRDTFDTPTLIECWRTAPYLHDGRYTTIQQLLTEGKHGNHGEHVVTLTKKQSNDLAEYVLSLPATVSIGEKSADASTDPKPVEMTAPVDAPEDADPTTDKEPTAESGMKLTALGKVIDAEGNPVTSATVYLRKWDFIRVSDDPYNQNPQDVLATTKTDAEGTFRFENVTAPPSEQHWNERAPWGVVVMAEGYGMMWQYLRMARDDTPMIFTLQPEATVTGRLVDSKGSPIAGAEIKVTGFAALGSPIRGSRTEERLNLWYSRLGPKVQTQADGRFIVDGLPPQMRVRLYAQHEQFVRTRIFAATTNDPRPDLEEVMVRSGERQVTKHKVHTGDFTVEIKRGFHVHGQTVLGDPKRPCPGATVVLYWKDRAHFAIADTEGRFVFHGLSEPQWYVHVLPSEMGEYLGRRIQLPLLSPEKPEAEVEVELPRGEVVRGRVVDEKTGKGVPSGHVYFNDGLPEYAPDRLQGS
ncbi:MAG: hypothetical protein V3R99_01200, partial [Thermoguttaceae bacterium]